MHLQNEKVSNIKPSPTLDKAIDERSSEYYFQEGLIAHQQNAYAIAAAYYRYALDLTPNYFDPQHLLGVIAAQTGNPAQAIEYINIAIKINSNQSEGYYNRGQAYQQLGQFDQALADYVRAVDLNPNNKIASLALSTLFTQLHKWPEALFNYQHTLSLSPTDHTLYQAIGEIYLKLKQYSQAINYFNQAVSINPHYFDAHCQRGITLHAIQNYNEALVAYDHALQLQTEHAGLHNNRGNTLLRMGQWDEAIQAYAKAIAIEPQYAAAHYNLGTALQKKDALAPTINLALSHYQKALSLKPDYAEAHNNCGLIYKERHQYEAAIHSYQQSIKHQPDYGDAHWNLGLCLLLIGEYGAGWAELEWRWQLAGFPSPNRNFSQGLWQGQSSLQDKTILLHAEQGLGDTIQFCRFTKLVKALGATVILEVQKPLMSLMQSMPNVDQVIGQSDTLPLFDMHCPLLSLPLAFNITVETIPNASKSYLNSNLQRVTQLQVLLGEKNRPRIGLAWSGNPKHRNDANRSLALKELIRHLPQGYDYISLQKEIRPADAQSLSQNPQIRHFGDQIHDFADTAALCELMDLVISVDTSVAHLAGALGKPVWILLPYCPDWRWLLERTDSPWYPTATLFRATQAGDWHSALIALQLAIVREFPPGARL